MQYKPGDIVTVRKDLMVDTDYQMYDSAIEDTVTDEMAKYAGGNICIEETQYGK